MPRPAKKVEHDHGRDDRDSITTRLRRIRDLLLGREPGPLTETRDAIVPLVAKLDAALLAVAQMTAAITAMAAKIDAILAAVAPQAEKATSFAITAEAVPVEPPLPVEPPASIDKP